MKKLVLIFCLLFLLTGSAQAQQVLGPTAVGSVFRYYYAYYTHTSGSSYSWSPSIETTTALSGQLTVHRFLLYIPTSFIISMWTDAVMEFDISGVTPAGVTAANFRNARLDGLSVSGTNGIGAMTVLLYDMEDVDEDGSVTVNDYHSMRGSGTTLLTTVPTVGTTYGNIDVTDALLHDLFGAAQSGYSGFLLYTESTTGKTVAFNPTTPTLTIFIKNGLSAVNFLLLKD